MPYVFMFMLMNFENSILRKFHFFLKNRNLKTEDQSNPKRCFLKPIFLYIQKKNNVHLQRDGIGVD